MIEFQCLKLVENTVEDYERLPQIGDVMQNFKRWAEKQFTVASVDTSPRLYPLVMLREIVIRHEQAARLPDNWD